MDSPAGPTFRCGQCGYDVRGLPTAVCPECGGNLHAVGVVDTSRRGWGWMAWIASIVVATVCVVGPTWGLSALADLVWQSQHRWDESASLLPASESQRDFETLLTYQAIGSEYFYVNLSDEWKKGVPVDRLSIGIGWSAWTDPPEVATTTFNGMSTTELIEIEIGPDGPTVEGKAIDRSELQGRLDALFDVAPELADLSPELRNAAGDYFWSMAIGERRLQGKSTSKGDLAGWSATAWSRGGGGGQGNNDFASVMPCMGPFISLVLVVWFPLKTGRAVDRWAKQRRVR